MNLDLSVFGSAAAASAGYQVLSSAIAAIIGAASVLLAVWLTGRNSRAAQREQLRHDAVQRRIERRAALRREIYVQYTESLIRSLAAIGGVGSPDFVQKAAEDYMKEFAVANAKMCTVARETTARLAFEVASKITELWISASAERLPLSSLLDQANRTQIKIDRNDVEIHELRRELRRIHPSPENVFIVEKLTSSLTQLINENVELSESYLRFHIESAPTTIALSRTVLGEIAKLQTLQHSLLLQMRRDVGAKTSDELAKQLTAFQDALVERLNRVVKDLEAKPHGLTE